MAGGRAKILSCMSMERGHAPKFKIEFGGLFEDLPRSTDGTAIIADPRNDENLMIAGLHAAFLLFHNKAVDLIEEHAPSRGARRGVPPGPPAHHMALPVDDPA